MSSHTDIVDLLVVGGGINGAGVACDAAGRGLSVVLCEQGDLAGATSSASSKLVHGGLRYLEHYEFRLVRESLAERSALLNKAPHIVRPKRFVLPLGPGMRPAWMVAAGLFLYDHLSARDSRLPNSQRLDLHGAPEGAALSSGARVGFAYSDCTMDDARLVVLNALAAAENGARILTRTAFVSARREEGVWRATLRDSVSGGEETVYARAIVNAAGPWVSSVIDAVHEGQTHRDVRLVKGSHIVVPRLYDGDQAYILQNDDGRVVFVIPYQGDFTLIGTTEHDLDAPPPLDGQGFGASAEETDYLCHAVNRYFKTHIAPADVVWAYAGVRPLFAHEAASATSVTREYVLDVQSRDGAAPLVSVFGGKLTTYRRLAEKVLERLKPFVTHMGAPWTLHAPLPGGDLPNGGMDALLLQLHRDYPWADDALLSGLMARHGTRAARVLGDAAEPTDLGQDFGHGLTACEVDYLMTVEWARSGDDVLWRRTKLGLRFDTAQRAALEAYVTSASACLK